MSTYMESEIEKVEKRCPDCKKHIIVDMVVDGCELRATTCQNCNELLMVNRHGDLY